MPAAQRTRWRTTTFCTFKPVHLSDRDPVILTLPGLCAIPPITCVQRNAADSLPSVGGQSQPPEVPLTIAGTVAAARADRSFASLRCCAACLNRGLS